MADRFRIAWTKQLQQKLFDTNESVVWYILLAQICLLTDPVWIDTASALVCASYFMYVVVVNSIAATYGIVFIGCRTIIETSEESWSCSGGGGGGRWDRCGLLVSKLWLRLLSLIRLLLWNKLLVLTEEIVTGIPSLLVEGVIRKLRLLIILRKLLKLLKLWEGRTNTTNHWKW